MWIMRVCTLTVRALRACPTVSTRFSVMFMFNDENDLSSREYNWQTIRSS